MKLKICIFIIAVETVAVIIFSLSMFSKQEFSFVINDPLPHSVMIYNSNLWAEISLTDEGQLAAVSAVDTIGRTVHVSYSDIGITSYVITDTKTNYKVEKLFTDNFSADMVIGKNNSLEEINTNKGNTGKRKGDRRWSRTGD
jgi:hypothetical protein